MPGTAAIIGGSLTGLITARLLSLGGWDTHIFERLSHDLAGRGAGIGTHPELFDVLREAEIRIPDDIGIRVDLRRVLTRQGVVSHELRYPQVLAHWDRLYALLRRATPDQRYHLDRHLVSFEEGPEGVSLRFADGSTFEADLLIGADGIRSTVRSGLFPDIRPQYAGYVAWRCVVPEEALSEATRRSIFEHFCFCLPEGEQVAGYPIRPADRGAAPSGREYNVIWYRPADPDRLRALLTDTSGQVHEMNIPPPLIDPRHRLEAKQDAEAIMAPQFAEAIRLAEGLFCQPIYDVDVSGMVRGSIALLGDAAFVARPHVGAGVTKGFSDAMALRRALDGHERVEDALRAFDAERLPVGQKILERARRLGAYMQASRATDAERKSAEAYRTPEAVIRETASLDFLGHPKPDHPPSPKPGRSVSA
jgi:2-polyprenyl-6-methoxyphenol hydroxylase-like FAD-dependent oxidoreductase